MITTELVALPPACFVCSSMEHGHWKYHDGCQEIKEEDWICKIGIMYFDPTYNRSSLTPGDVVERILAKLTPALWLSEDRRFLYARNLDAAPRFTDSWNEMNAKGWISSADWKTKTARFGHSRSADLVQVDTALQAFEKQGAATLAALKTAFKNWFARNPQEASSRNVDNCVTGLASFLGV